MTTISQARGRSWIKPVYLVEIVLKNSGPTLYLSDRIITVGSQTYDDYITEITGLEAELRRADSGGLNAGISLELKNEKYKTYDHLSQIGDTYPWVGAGVTIKELYLEPPVLPGASEGQSDVTTVFVGNVDEPRDTNRLTFSLSVSSRPTYRANLWEQVRADETTYPAIHPDDVGMVEPVIFAQNAVGTIRTTWGAVNTLATALTAGATTVALTSAAAFPASGSVVVDDERIAYTGKSGDSLTGCTRGSGGTTATAHAQGSSVVEYLAEYRALICRHEVYSLDAVYGLINGKLVLVPAGQWSLLYTGGKSYVSLNTLLHVKPQVETITVTENIDVSLENSNAQHYLLYATNNLFWDFGVTGDKTMNFPSAPAASLTNVTSKFNIVIDEGIPPTLGYDLILKCRGVAVATWHGNGGGVGSWTWTDEPGSYHLHHDITWQTSFIWNVSTNGGGGTAQFSVVNCTEEATVPAITSQKTGTVTKAGTVVRSDVIEKIFVSVKGLKDPTGDYGGSGTLIERPDNVIKFFLASSTLYGFGLGAIDSASFTAAGANYDSNFKLRFPINETVDPETLVRQMAFEARATVTFRAGKWYMNWIPSTAPASVVKTVSKDDLIGDPAEFVFNTTPRVDVANVIYARWKKDYMGYAGTDLWAGTYVKDDVPAGWDRIPKHIDFSFVRNSAMVASVVGVIWNQLSKPLATVRFRVPWECLDLVEGDTIDISNPINNGMKFFIEKITRLDQARAEINAIAWWS